MSDYYSYVIFQNDEGIWKPQHILKYMEAQTSQPIYETFDDAQKECRILNRNNTKRKGESDE